MSVADDLRRSADELKAQGRRIRQVRFHSKGDALRLLDQHDAYDPRLELPEPTDPRPVWPGPDLVHIPVVWDPDLGPDEIRIDCYPEPT